jgi:hypothetical protein
MVYLYTETFYLLNIETKKPGTMSRLLCIKVTVKYRFYILRLFRLLLLYVLHCLNC